MVLVLEGLWWAEDWAAFVARDKAAWSWRMMIRQPDWLPRELLTQAISDAAAKGPFAAALVRQRELEEGRCVQTLHVSSYDDEGPLLARLHEEYLPQRGLVPGGLHHEI